MKTGISSARSLVLARMTLAVLPLTCVVIFPAAAQNVTQMPTTTVTANRFEQDVQSAPVAVSILTGAQILASGATDANDAIRKLLGIASRTDLTGGRNNSLDFRGFGATASQNVVVIVDGIRISENEDASPRLSAIAPEQIESIEVVRGGSSVQWGEGASAGLINVVLKKGGPKGVSGSATAQLESLNGRDGRANIRLVGEDVTFDANVRSYSSNSYRDNNNVRQDTSSVGFSGVSGASKFRLRVSTEDQANRLPGPLSLLQFSQDPRQASTPNNFGNFAETRLFGGFEHVLGRLVLSVDAGVRDKSSSYFYDYGGGSTTSGNTASRHYQISPKAVYKAALGSSALTLVGGQDYNRWNFGAKDSNGQNEQAYQFNNASYLIGDIMTTTGTRFIAGVRKEDVSKRAEDANNFVSYNRSDSLDAWDFGVNQEISSGLNAYFRSAKSYRLPNVDENRYLSAALRPQNSRDLELGVKISRPNGSGFLARVFEQNTIDEVAFNQLDPACLPFGCNTNLDPTRRTGVELEGQMHVSSAVRIQGSVQSVDARFSAGTFAGKQLPSVSPLSGALRAIWMIDSQRSFIFGAQFLSSSRFTNDVANACSATTPDRTLIDARYAWKKDKIELSLAANNLMDQKSYSNAITNATCSAVNVYPDPGRMLNVAIKYNF